MSTASDPADYWISPSPLTITAGTTLASVTVTVVDDGDVELLETVIVDMGPPVNASAVAPTTHTIAITDNDP